MAKRRKPAKPPKSKATRRPKSRKPSTVEKRRSLAAAKGWETRRANERAAKRAAAQTARQFGRARAPGKPVEPSFIPIVHKGEEQRKVEEADTLSKQAFAAQLYRIVNSPEAQAQPGARRLSKYYAKVKAERAKRADRDEFLIALSLERDPSIHFAILQDFASNADFTETDENGDRHNPFWYH